MTFMSYGLGLCLVSFTVFGPTRQGSICLVVLLVLLTLPYNSTVHEAIPNAQQSDMNPTQKLCHLAYRYLTASSEFFVDDKEFGHMTHEAPADFKPQMQHMSRPMMMFNAVYYGVTGIVPSTDAYPVRPRTCTTSSSCSSHATSVSGNPNTGCTCTCRNQWTGATCATCASKFNSASDCGTCAAGYDSSSCGSELC
jgi:hypothetical protein